MTNGEPKPGEWHLWLGGAEPPPELADTDRVFLRYRDGIESKVRVVSDVRWSHDDLPDDIVAWRFSHHKGD